MKLEAAEYNPRKISKDQLQKLEKSIEKFGDLSGIVFNSSTNRLVSGHQRVKSLSKYKKKIVKEKVTDGKGTTALGHVEFYVNDDVIKIPYREVKWSSEVAEMAANVAANSLGGDWDDKKLKIVLDKLVKKKFDVESLDISLSADSVLPSTDRIADGKNSGGTFTYSTFESKFILLVEFPTEKELQKMFEGIQKNHPDWKLTIMD